MNAPEVVVCGEAMMLMLAEPGVPLRVADTFHRSVAGAETNVGVGLARLGHTVRWLGRLGADPAGDFVLRSMRAEGVDVGAVIVDPDRPTGMLMRDCHAGRPIEVQYFRTGSAAAAAGPAGWDERLLEGVRLLHITGITAMLSPDAAEAVGRLLRLARRAGVTISFDPNVRQRLAPASRWRSVVGPLLGRVDLLFAGADELELLTGEPAGRSERTVAGLLTAGVGTVLVKAADKSVSAFTASGRCHQPPFAVPVVDPVGAGDAFAAGYLSGWLRGRPPDACLAEAATVAAMVVQCAGDVAGLPTPAERDRALAAVRSTGVDLVVR